MTGTTASPNRSGAGGATGAPALAVRVGTDVQIIEAMELTIRRHGRRYLDRTFTPQEVQACGGYDAEPHLLAPGLAARFSAKEAVLRALRPTKIMPEWPDVELVSMPGDWLRIELTGAARKKADHDGVVDLQVSVSFNGPVAIAMVVGLVWPK